MRTKIYRRNSMARVSLETSETERTVTSYVSK